MTLAGELAGTFLAGIGFTLIMLAVFAGRLSKWAMRRMLLKATLTPAPSPRPGDFLTHLAKSVEEQGGIPKP